MFNCSSVRDVLEAGVSKMLKIFPLASKTLQMAPVAKPENRKQYSVSQIKELVLSFSISDPQTLDKLGQEWVDF